MAFMMNVRSINVTACAGDIGDKAAPYIARLSTNPQITTANVAPVLKNSAPSFPMAQVGVISAQQISSVVDPNSNGRA